MDFKSFWFAMPKGEREAFARKVDRSPGYLQLVAGGFRDASPGLANTIQEQSEGRVTREEMRADIFGPPKDPPPGSGQGIAA